MNAHYFHLSSTVTPERLSWFEECLKFFFVQLFPETLTHQKTTGSPVFTFFLSGDALYSLTSPETLQIWNIILSFPPVRIECNRQELDLRGISAGPLKMKFPDQVTDTGSTGPDGKSSFYKDLATATRMTKSPLPGTAGWLQTTSPYMDRSASYGLSFLSAAIDEHLSAEFYAFLDGVHCGHHGQHPADDQNIGEGLVTLNERATAAGLSFHALGCAGSSASRGYSTWDDGQGQVISTCTIRTFRIRDISQMVDRFCSPHPILAADAGILMMRPQSGTPSFDRAEKMSRVPPLTILVTQYPYSTEYARGAIELAVASAHAGILTRVIFIEDGIYALTGIHRQPENTVAPSLQELINIVAGSENLHFFAFTPSLQRRGIGKDRNLNAVLDIGYPGLGKIFFYPPGNVQSDLQRVFFF